jgi:hypothetical protein
VAAIRTLAVEDPTNGAAFVCNANINERHQNCCQMAAPMQDGCMFFTGNFFLDKLSGRNANQPHQIMVSFKRKAHVKLPAWPTNAMAGVRSRL